MKKVLIIDDEQNILFSLKTFLEIKGYSVITADSVEKGKACFLSLHPDAVILDVYLSGESGLDLLPLFREKENSIPVIMISGHSSIQTAVQAIKEGAFDFLEKPIDTEKLEIALQNGLNMKDLRNKVEALKNSWVQEHFYIGSTERMQQAASTIKKAGPTEATVLIRGANGVGKEPAAYYVYLNSPRFHSPFITVNCAAIPGELFESQLFGHKKGAFTGAVSDFPGYFQQADTGTLFLDEIAEVPLPLQAKLLRAIEYKQVQGPGMRSQKKVDVRIIAATNRDLEKEVANGCFREDLFFRLNQIPVYIPALDERREDIPEFVRRFAKEAQQRHSITAKEFTASAIQLLCSLEYKGNIRELRNIVERLVILSGDTITKEDVQMLSPGSASKERALFAPKPLKQARADFEREYIQRNLAANQGSVKATAQSIGMLPNNLSRRMKELEVLE
ncbi:MAG: sigma-54-dependent transcriptional regulator [Spirochaetia bacterium]